MKKTPYKHSERWRWWHRVSIEVARWELNRPETLMQRHQLTGRLHCNSTTPMKLEARLVRWAVCSRLRYRRCRRCPCQSSSSWGPVRSSSSGGGRAGCGRRGAESWRAAEGIRNWTRLQLLLLIKIGDLRFGELVRTGKVGHHRLRGPNLILRKWKF